MNKSSFVYVTYIRTTPEKLWDALTGPEFIEQFWFGYRHETEWRKGAPWKMIRADGTVTDAGEILEVDPPRRLVIKWRNEFRPELKADGFTRCTIEAERRGELMKLTITHEADKPEHKLIGAVSQGWPQVLASLKSLLETGTALPRPDQLPKG